LFWKQCLDQEIDKGACDEYYLKQRYGFLTLAKRRTVFGRD
ncbi:MAG: hypothetical protein RLZZ243_717, partial [Bacteroidota bacterium]